MRQHTTSDTAPTARALRLLIVLGALLLGHAGASLAQLTEPADGSNEITLLVGEQKTLSPGYALGDIAVGDPKIADFRVVANRRELTMIARGPGRTVITLWDQKNVKRGEMTIVVVTRESIELERDLKQILQDYPAVALRTVGGALTMTGAVSSKDDLAAIEKIATTFKVRNLVRYVAPVVPGSPATGESTPGSLTPSSTAALIARIDYEVELFEASSQFRSGSYATGVEPSGRSLFKGTVSAAPGGEGLIFIGGRPTARENAKSSNSRDADRKSSTSDGVDANADSGIRLTLKPQAPERSGRFSTFVLVETNLPFDGTTYDPDTWRRARWQFTAASGEPFGITGSDLLATPDPDQRGGSSRGATVARTAQQVGAGRATRKVPGAEAVPVLGSLFGSSSYKQKKTQLLVVLRPRVAN